jgi:hypothetical protein
MPLTFYWAEVKLQDLEKISNGLKASGKQYLQS